MQLKDEQLRNEGKLIARIMFQTASVLSRMIASNQSEFNIMKEYEWLYTEKEIQDAKRQMLLASLEKNARGNSK